MIVSEVSTAMDLRKAYEILDLPENSSMEEVDQRFDLLLRRMKGKRSEEGMGGSENINEAYRIIKESARQAAIDQYNEARFGSNPQKKARREKIEHFWSYYRWHVVGSIIVIIIAVMVIQGVIERQKLAALPPPDLEIMLYGDYFNADEGSLERAILQKYPDWQRIKVIVNFLPNGSFGGQEMAYVQKSFAILATEHPDVYILDSSTFQKMVEQSALANLDDLKGKTPTELSTDKMLIGTQPEDSEPHLYGIDITDRSLWNSSQEPEVRKIATIGKRSKNTENAKNFINGFID